MGTIVNKFTCVEFSIDPNYDNPVTTDVYKELEEKFQSIRDVVESSSFRRLFNLAHGSNGNMYFTAMPSGSKAGWGTSNDHAAEVKMIIGKIQEVADFSIVNTTITSEG